MDIENLPEEIRDFTEPGTISANKFCGYSLLGIIGIIILSAFVHNFFPTVKHSIELVQALLVCSTALMGLTGVMIIETKKAKVRQLPDGWERVTEINRICSLTRALVFLKWSFLVSIFSIIFSCWWLANDTSFCMAGAFFAFVGQLYFLLFALIFSDFLPS